MSGISRTVLSSAVRATRSNARAGHSHAPAAYRTPSINELPVPSGSWQEYNSARQRANNVQLLLGVIFTAATFVWGYADGSYYLNPGPQYRN